MFIATLIVARSATVEDVGMWLRIRSTSPPGPLAAATSEPDGWATRLAKLIPAEALGLYGTGSSLVPQGHTEGLWALGAVCLVFSAVLRFMATRDDAGRPQWLAIVIAVVSFVLWLAALGSPASPIDLGDYGYIGGLGALVWATVLPAFYKGD